MLPSKTLAFRDEQSASGYKKGKDRVTVLGCYNLSETLKLKSISIDKAKNTFMVFEKINVSCLPVLYKSQESGWMDCQIFKDWFISQSPCPVSQSIFGEKKICHKKLYYCLTTHVHIQMLKIFLEKTLELYFYLITSPL